MTKETQADPLAGVHLGAGELTQRLMSALKNEKGVHIESLLCALGALAGYACQAAVRAQAARRGAPHSHGLTMITTQDGGRLFFGDALNRLLLESQYSVWSIAAGGAQSAGCTDLLDINELATHTAKVAGSPAFGKLRVPEAHQSGDEPIAYVRALWTKLLPMVSKFCSDPEHWPKLFALSAQETIIAGKSVLDPGLALRIVMEAAMPASKIELTPPLAAHTTTDSTQRPTTTRIAPVRHDPAHGGTRARHTMMKWVVLAVALVVSIGATVRNVDRRAEQADARQAREALISKLQADARWLDARTAARTDELPEATPANEEPIREAEFIREDTPDSPPPRRSAAAATVSSPPAGAVSHLFVVQRPMSFPPGLHGAHSAAFIVMPGVPYPLGDPGHSIVLTME